MVNVEPYGGGLWHTWFDRDLTVAGSVLVRGSDGSLSYRLVSTHCSNLSLPVCQCNQGIRMQVITRMAEAITVHDTFPP